MDLTKFEEACLAHQLRLSLCEAMGVQMLVDTLPHAQESTQPSDCCATSALFNPCGIACDLHGTVYVADTGQHRICMLRNGVISVLAGSGTRGWADGPGSKAMFAHPCGIAIDADGNVFVADCGNQRIRQISPDGMVLTIAGSGSSGHRDGPGKHAAFNNPCGIAIDYISNDVLYVADYSNNCVRVVSRGGFVSTLTKHTVPIDSPYGIAVFMQPNELGSHDPRVYVTSYHTHSLAEILPDGVVKIIAGCGVARHADGERANAAFQAPNGVAVDSEGTLYVADSGNNCVRSVTPDGYVSTVAGSGISHMGDGAFNSPCGVCVGMVPDRGTVLLIADRSNSCVRVVPTEALPPPRVYPSTIRQDLASLLDGSPEYHSGEAVFNVDGRTLSAPKAILCARCPHFRAMFSSGMRESFAGSVEVPGVGYATYRSLLSYLLTDELTADLPTPVLLELMMLANAYGVKRLEQLCALAIARLLSERNAKEVLCYAEMIGECYLQRAAEKLVLNTDISESPIEIM
ncbi:hypothetical protein AB1Y20_016283 [Prymnesium parvum]|uniref:BTB domain-containing protein n=1 Tax=Prymnesium parvum TaxID=97485 RepID=A0AB34IES6_PRYPA